MVFTITMGGCSYWTVTSPDHRFSNPLPPDLLSVKLTLCYSLQCTCPGVVAHLLLPFNPPRENAKHDATSDFFFLQMTALPSRSCVTECLHHAIITVILFHAGKGESTCVEAMEIGMLALPKQPEVREEEDAVPQCPLVMDCDTVTHRRPLNIHKTFNLKLFHLKIVLPSS